MKSSILLLVPCWPQAVCDIDKDKKTFPQNSALLLDAKKENLLQGPNRYLTVISQPSSQSYQRQFVLLLLEIVNAFGLFKSSDLFTWVGVSWLVDMRSRSAIKYNKSALTVSFFAFRYCQDFSCVRWSDILIIPEGWEVKWTSHSLLDKNVDEGPARTGFFFKVVLVTDMLLTLTLGSQTFRIFHYLIQHSELLG